MQLFLREETETQGEFLDYISYNAVSGKWTVKDGGDVKEVKDVKVLCDIENLQVGWLGWVPANEPGKNRPDFHPYPKLDQPTDKPAEGYEIATRLNMSFAKKSGLGVREWTCTSNIGKDAVQELLNAYMSDKDDNKGKVPVVHCTSTEAVKNYFGTTNYKPIFEITAWKDRPDELPNEIAAPTAAPAPAGEDVPVDDDEFV